MTNQQYNRGAKLALTTAGISGFAVFINKFGIKLWESASVYTTAKNIVAALILTGVLVGLKKLPELKQLSKKQWSRLVLIGLIGGSIPFLLFFKSITLIPAPEAAFIHKTLFLWVALFSYPFLKERLSTVQLTALGILFAGVFLFAKPAQWSFGIGSAMALGATLLWAIENIIAKITLKDVSAITVAWARMALGALFLLAYLAATEDIAGIIPSTMNQAGITLLVGAVLFGYVFTWYSALKAAPATIVSSILVIAAPITAILNGIFLTNTFPTKVVIPLALMLGGVFLMVRFSDYFTKQFKQTGEQT